MLAQGDLDHTFGTGGVAFADFQKDVTSNDFIQAIQVQSDGKTLAATQLAIVRYLSDGTFDPTFDGDGKIAVPGNIKVLQLLDDGSFLAAGYTSAPANSVMLAKYNPDGSLDTAFGINGISRTLFTGPWNNVNSICVQSDGKILLGGTILESQSSLILWRYNADGSLDTTFNGDGIDVLPANNFVGSVSSVAVQNDGSVLVAGYFMPDANHYQKGLTRLKVNGDVDTSFGTNGKITGSTSTVMTSFTDVGIQSTGQIITSDSEGMILRYNVDGTPDATAQFPFTLGWTVNDIKVLSDDKVAFISRKNHEIGRFNADGSYDTSFAQDGTQMIDAAFSNFATFDVSSTGNCVVGGNKTATSPDVLLQSFQSDGSVNTSFGLGGLLTSNIGIDSHTPNSMLIQSDGKILIGGSDFLLQRFNADGSLDTTFSGGGTPNPFDTYSQLFDIALQSDGKILAAGMINIGSVLDTIALVRFNTDGSLDTSFGVAGLVSDIIPGFNSIAAVYVQADKKILLCSPEGALIQYNSDGIRDMSFGWQGKGFAVLSSGNRIVTDQQADGKIVAAGYDLGAALSRVNPDASRDTTFGINGRTSTLRNGGNIAFDLLGRIVVISGTHVERINPDGTADKSFGTQGIYENRIKGAFCSIADVITQADGKILLGSMYDWKFAVTRLNVDGTLDTSFGDQGTKLISTDPLQSVTTNLAIQSDGNIVIGGSSSAGSRNNYTVVRLLASADSFGLIANETLTLPEKTSKAIPQYALCTYSSETLPANILYQVTSTTIHGKLVFATDPATSITSFTQDDLNNNRVVYVHDKSLNLSDSFFFKVSAGEGKDIGPTRFNIEMTIANLGPVLVTVNGLSPNAVSVLENTTQVGVFSAIDPESNPIVYSIIGGSDQSFFNINSTSGYISFIAPPDFENPLDSNHDNIYELQMQAFDAVSGRSVNLTTTVTVTDGVLAGSSVVLKQGDYYILKSPQATDSHFTISRGFANGVPTLVIADSTSTSPDVVIGAFQIPSAIVSKDHKSVAIPLSVIETSPFPFLIMTSEGHDVVKIDTNGFKSDPIPRNGISISGGDYSLELSNNATNNTWTFTGQRAGNVQVGTMGKIDFWGLSKAIGGTGKDVFKIANIQNDNLILDGGANGAVNQVQVSRDANFTLNDAKITIDPLPGGEVTQAFLLAHVQSAVLTGGKGDNFIDASKFTGSATLNGGDGSDILWGGSGNDLLNGGNGADWLSGGAGDDQLNGGANRDILVGGLGRDVLYGATASTNESAENILIGGSTLQDNSKPANQALLLTWSSSNPLPQRLTTIQSAGFKLNKNTVANDNSIDSLIGSDGFDWFLLQTTAINADIHNADAQEKVRWLTW